MWPSLFSTRYVSPQPRLGVIFISRNRPFSSFTLSLSLSLTHYALTHPHTHSPSLAGLQSKFFFGITNEGTHVSSLLMSFCQVRVVKAKKTRKREKMFLRLKFLLQFKLARHSPKISVTRFSEQNSGQMLKTLPKM